MKEINLVIHNSNISSFKKKLESLGISPHPCGSHTNNKHDSLYIINNEFYSNTPINCEGGIRDTIDCKECRDLVIDLVKYNINLDKGQWFIFDDTEYVESDRACRFFYKCRSDSIEIDLCYDMMFTFCTRATIKQVVDYYLIEKGA